MIAETPWWMYVLIIALCQLAYLSTKTRTIALKPLVIFNCAYIAIFIISLFVMPESTAQNMAITAACLSIGIFLGWLQYRFSRIKAIKETFQIEIPGSKLLFIILVIFIFAQYYYQYYYLASTDFTTDIFILFNQEKFAALFYGLMGLVIGLTVGRTYYLLRCMR